MASLIDEEPPRTAGCPALRARSRPEWASGVSWRGTPPFAQELPMPFALAALLCLSIPGPQAPVQSTASRVTVTDPASPVPGMVGVERFSAAPAQGSSLAPPPVQLPGFPITIGAHGNFAPWRSGVIEDLDRDGDNELLVASTDGRLHGFDGTGAPLPGFPVITVGFPQYAPSVADLEGDG